MEKIKQALELAKKDRLAIAGDRQEQLGARPSSADDVDGASPKEESANPVVADSSPPADGPASKDSLLAKTRRPDAASNRVLTPAEFTHTRMVDVAEDLLHRNRVVLPDAEDEASRAYDALTSRLLKKADANGWNSLAVISPSAGEGKTLTAINLALHIAASWERTALVVDLDLRRPAVAEYLGLEPDIGIEDVLAGTAAIEEALISPGIPRFAALPARRAMCNTARLMDSALARSIAQELKQRYQNRIVLFDLPPLLANGDAHRFLPNTDGSLLVATEGKTSRDSIERMLASLGDTPLVGAVMNQSSEAASGY